MKNFQSVSFFSVTNLEWVLTQMPFCNLLPKNIFSYKCGPLVDLILRPCFKVGSIRSKLCINKKTLMWRNYEKLVKYERTGKTDSFQKKNYLVSFIVTTAIHHPSVKQSSLFFVLSLLRLDVRRWIVEKKSPIKHSSLIFIHLTISAIYKTPDPTNNSNNTWHSRGGGGGHNKDLEAKKSN